MVETAATVGVSVVFGVLHCGALRFGTVTPHGPASTEYCIPYMVIVLSVSCPCSQAVKALFKSAGSAVTSVEYRRALKVTYPPAAQVK